MSTKEEKKQQADRAARLRRQIEELKKGKTPVPDKIKNPRDYIEEKMREIAEKEKAEGEEIGELPNDD